MCTPPDYKKIDSSKSKTQKQDVKQDDYKYISLIAKMSRALKKYKQMNERKNEDEQEYWYDILKAKLKKTYNTMRDENNGDDYNLLLKNENSHCEHKI